MNNAGQYFDLPCRLEELTPQFLAGHVGINALAPTLLCKMALPGMKARRRGLIVNIGSGVASAMPQAPYLQVGRRGQAVPAPWHCLLKVPSTRPRGGRDVLLAFCRPTAPPKPT